MSVLDDEIVSAQELEPYVVAHNMYYAVLKSEVNHIIQSIVERRTSNRDISSMGYSYMIPIPMTY